MTSVHQLSSLAEVKSLSEQNSYFAVYCYADWLGDCRVALNLYEQAAEGRSLPGHLAFAKYNIEDDGGELASEFGVEAMPAFLFFEGGSPVEINGVARLIGVNPDALESATATLHERATQRQADEA
ncbi:hypothetical protein SLS53_002188 [Cytospora paraplurivora]|uniref:Thioredoxin domain-containing protein n=1 Tax=Cytospora paraplurivora TaxID=2898453 RepID=A0AAN9UE11_9PEZI